MQVFQPKEVNEKGASLLEVLISIIFIAIISLSIMWSTIASAKYEKYTEIGNIAMNLAISKAEELSGVALNDLDDSYDNTEGDLLADGHNIPFIRSTNITINGDGSRTIDITVSAATDYLPSPISYSTTFAPWES